MASLTPLYVSDIQDFTGDDNISIVSTDTDDTLVITCQGCIEMQPNQLAHMDEGGCLWNPSTDIYVDSDCESVLSVDNEEHDSDEVSSSAITSTAATVQEDEINPQDPYQAILDQVTSHTPMGAMLATVGVDEFPQLIDIDNTDHLFDEETYSREDVINIFRQEDHPGFVADILLSYEEGEMIPNIELYEMLGTYDLAIPGFEYEYTGDDSFSFISFQDTTMALETTLN